MSPLTLSRLICALLWVNEGFLVSRSTAEERSQLVWPRFTPISILLLFIPFFIAIDYPLWVQWLIVIVQIVALGMEVAGEIQLTRAKAFSIAPKAPAAPQTGGLYRYLENPIYVAALAHLFIWGLWMPLAWIGVALQYDAFRGMVKNERNQLATINFVHRKTDSFLWN